MKTDRRAISAEAAERGEKKRKAYLAMLQQYGGSVFLSRCGAKGGVFCFLIHGHEHYTRMARESWNLAPRALEVRRQKHRASMAKARAVLAAQRAAQRKHGREWVLGRFRDNLHASGDPKAALRKVFCRDERRH